MASIPDGEVIANCAIDIGQGEGGNVEHVTDGMVDFVYGNADVGRSNLSTEDRRLVEDQTAEAIETALKINGYWYG